jgi:Chain length determinant protein
MLSDFDLIETYHRLLARWLWVLGIAMAAGVLGLLLSFSRPMVYQASALIGVDIDRSRANVPDDITVRQAYDRVRALVLADDTLQRAISEAALAGSEQAAPSSIAAFRDHIRLSERADGWELIVQGGSAAEAEGLASVWADASLEQISDALLHAIRAAEWQSILYEASCRLQPGEPASTSAIWVCHSAPPLGSADAIPSSILSEVEASRGILPAFTYSLLQAPQGSAQAVLWNRGSLVLGGGLLGLVAGGLAAALLKRPTAP